MIYNVRKNIMYGKEKDVDHNQDPLLKGLLPTHLVIVLLNSSSSGGEER